MRLIDADKLKPIIVPIAPLFPDEEVHCEQAYLKNEVDAQPTIEERPKGKWIADGFYYYHGIPFDYHKCTCCNEKFKQRFDYCPHCGADMREVD